MSFIRGGELVVLSRPPDALNPPGTRLQPLKNSPGARLMVLAVRRRRPSPHPMTIYQQQKAREALSSVPRPRQSYRVVVAISACPAS